MRFECARSAVRQANLQSDFRRLWRASDRITVWSGSTVEIRSALSRLHRENLIDIKGLPFSISCLEAMHHQWREIVPSEKLRSLAEGLPNEILLSICEF